MQALTEIEFYAERNLNANFQNHFGIDICKCCEGFPLVRYHQRDKAVCCCFDEMPYLGLAVCKV